MRSLKIAGISALIAATAFFGIVFVARAQVLPAQNQVIFGPYPAGYVVSTSSNQNAKLGATTTPFFSNFFATNGNISNLTVDSLNGVLYAINGLVGATATTTVSCSGSTTCSTFTVFGNSPITITSTATDSGLATTSPTNGGELLYYSAIGAGSAKTTATSSATCSGSVSCLGFTVVGSVSPNIVGTGLSSYDAFTHPIVGSSATSSLMLSNGNASSTQLSVGGFTYLATSTGSVGIGATSSPGSLLSINGIANFTTATSSFYSSGGINLTSGCFSVLGTCLQTFIQNATAYKSAVIYATAGILSGTPTYNNGSSGVGATLTEVGSGALSIDGASPSAGQRVLIKNEADQTTNGVYTVTATGSGIASYILTRATDFDESTEIFAGVTVPVLLGTVNADTAWTQTTTGLITLGSSNIVFAESSLGTAVVSSIKQTYGTAQTGAIILGTTTSTTNGLVSSLAITNSSGTFTLAPSTSGTLTVPGGGTGRSTFTSSELLYGNGTNALSSVATTSVTCSGGASCTSFTAIGSSPITITAPGSFSYPFTPTSWGVSTTTTFGFLNASNGIIVAASSTFSGNLFLTSLSQGVLYNGSLGLTRSTATNTPTGSDLTFVGTGATIGALQVNNPFAIATTSGIAQGQLPYYTQTSGKTTIGGVATTTLSGSGVISVTAGAVVLGGSPITVSCATCGTGSGTVTSITAGNDLLAATNPITTTGTINAQVGTSSIPTIPSLSYWTSVGSASNPARLGSVATSSVSAGTGITFSGTAGALVGGTSLTINGTDIYRIATTSDIAVPNLAYFTKTAGVTTLGSAATTSATINNGLTGTLTTIGGSQTIGLATINAGVLGAVVNGAVPTSQATSTLYGVAPAGGYVLGWDNTKNGINWIATSTGGGGTVSSVAVGSGLSASPSPITTTGTIYNPFAIATSSTLFALSGSVYVSQVSGMTTLASAATSTPTGVGITLAGTGATIGALQINNPFAIATTSDAAISGLATYTKVSGMTTLGNTSTSTLTASGPLTGSFTQIGSGGSLGCTTAASGVAGCLSNTAFDTFNNKLGSYDAWTHAKGSATTSAIGVGTTTPFSQLSVSTSTQSSAFTSLFAVASTTNATLLNVLGNGRVGIGTTTPTALLAVNPNALGSGIPAFMIGSTTGTLFRVDQDGSVSIGTSSPYSTNSCGTLCIDSTFGPMTEPDITIFGAGAFRAAIGEAMVNTESLVLYTQSYYPTIIGTNSTPRVYVQPSGAVGVATSTPWATLSVSTTTQSSGAFPLFAVASTTNGSIFNVFGNGSVGIGTTTPWGGLTIGRNGAVATTSIIVIEKDRAANEGTTTAMTIDARASNQQLIRIGASATTITLNVQTFLPGEKLILTVCNPNQSAGAITWATSNPAGALLWPGGTIPTQTTTANKCDIWSFLGTQATSTAAGTTAKLFGAQTANF